MVRLTTMRSFRHSGGEQRIWYALSELILHRITNEKLQSYQAYHARIVKKKPWNSLLIQLHKLSNGQSLKDSIHINIQLMQS